MPPHSSMVWFTFYPLALPARNFSLFRMNKLHIFSSDFNRNRILVCQQLINIWQVQTMGWHVALQRGVACHPHMEPWGTQCNYLNNVSHIIWGTFKQHITYQSSSIENNVKPKSLSTNTSTKRIFWIWKYEIKTSYLTFLCKLKLLITVNYYYNRKLNIM